LAPERQTTRRILVSVAVAIAGAVLYAPSIDNDLVFDDAFLLLQDGRITEPGRLGELWTGDYWPDERPSYNYRPLTSTTMALLARLGGTAPQRVTNLILHALCAALAVVLATELGLSLRHSALVGALFAVHPVHSEAVYLIVGRSELLATALSLAFLLGVLRQWHGIWLALFFLLAVLSKESTLILPAAGLLLYRFRNRDEPLRVFMQFASRLAGWTAPVVVAVFAVRWAIFGRLLTPTGYVLPLYNPLADLAWGPRVLNALWTQVLYLKAMVWPAHLSADYSLAHIELLDLPWDPRLVLALGLPIGFGVLLIARRTRWTLTVVGLSFVFLTILPASNILFRIGVMFGERLAYLPLFGFCLLVAAGARTLESVGGFRRRHGRFAIVALAGIVLTLSAARSLVRDRDWQTDDAFTTAAVRDAPNSAFAHGLRFLHLSRVGDDLAAERHVLRAVEIYPAYFDAWVSLAQHLTKQNRITEAIAAYETAAREVSRRPPDAHEAGRYHAHAASLRVFVGDLDGAAGSVKAAEAWLPPDDPQLQAVREVLRSRGHRQDNGP
jgi:hypothetical protein